MRTETEISADLEKAHRVADEITRQIENAQSEAKQSGSYSDSHWFNSARHARRATGRQIQRLQVELGEAKAAKRAENGKRGEEFARRFMINANLLLPQALYQQILNATMDEKGGAV